MPISYENYTKKELQQKAREKQKTCFWKLNKKDLITLLRSSKQCLCKKERKYYGKRGYAPDINIANIINENEIVIIGKEKCKYCSLAKKYLQEQDKKFKYIEYPSDCKTTKEQISELTNNSKSVPMIFVNKKFLKKGYEELKNKIYN